ncbi:HRDC-like protein [Irpex rosettiformis]|uniref:HRDC-like protein n=1 Tax=Irpex rosettiformis TaxID=378272 RepID=A0ACB8U2L1_9APHY|nr:HRDC-like protein [Irpex rosettiformis]
MEVISQRSALLSNFEVLTLLRELESDHLAKARTALKIKKEEEASGASSTRVHMAPEEVLENLRTIEVEAIQYLAADYQPTSRQTEAGITQLTRNLATYDLTKAEKLQIVNLAPLEPVELYVIVEELEDRFGEQIDDILSMVQASLHKPSSSAPVVENNVQAQVFYTEDDVHYEDDAENWGHDANEIVFDDHGEGAGIEGDLDVEDE